VVWAQQEIPVNLMTIDKERLPLQFRKYEKPFFADELSLKSNQLKMDLLSAGYATASIDSAFIRKDTAYLYVFLGDQYTITEIGFSDSSQAIMESVGLKKKWTQGNVLSANYLSGIQEGLIGKLEQNGYPYASVGFSNATMESTNLKLDLEIDTGPLMVFDTIHNLNQAGISKAYLSTYLGIKKGKRYDELLLKNMDARLAELPFLQLQSPSRVWFSSDNEAHVQVFLEDRKVSKFDFLIGVLPNNTNSGKVLITGEAGISLWNLFGNGEKIEVGWKRLQPQSQELNVYFDYPYILASSFGADVRFQLDKQDTSFLNLDWAIGLQYLMKGRDRIKIVLHNTQTFLQTADTSFIRSTNKLPPILDQTTLLSGIDAYFEQLDYVYNPSKGWEFGASVTAGLKKIKRNSAILQLDLTDEGITTAQLYDSLALKSAKLQFQWLGNYYLGFAKRQVLKIGLQGGAIYNKDILTNELLRIGGTENIRGFDEASIFTSFYNITTLEYRYLLDKNAFLSLFFDWAYTESRLKESFSNDFPFGFGLGLNFETKAGIFGVSYALGRQNGNPIDFRSSKVHFGYVNIF
jgi:outer membrane protein assembly factor BamA